MLHQFHTTMTLTKVAFQIKFVLNKLYNKPLWIFIIMCLSVSLVEKLKFHTPTTTWQNTFLYEMPFFCRRNKS